jgi:hypothetical protein
MRTFNSRNRVLAISLFTIAVGVGGACEQAKPAGPTTLAIANATDLPPVYTPQQCADLVSQFPGWSNVQPVPEYDANGLPAIFYAAIAISDPAQIDVLKAANVYVDSMPIFMDQSTRAKFDGKVGYVSKSTCGGGEIVWALLPGMVFNRLAQDTVKFNENFIPAVVFLPLPDAMTDTSITYDETIHPLTPSALQKAGFNAPQAASTPPASATSQAASAPPQVIAFGWNPISDIKEAAGDLGSLIDSGAKDVVNGVVDIGNTFKNLYYDFTGWAACEESGCVSVKVHLDVRNTDAMFGAQTLAGGDDGTTPIVRAWGANANNPIQLTGVTLTVRENQDWLGPISSGVEYSGTVQSNGVATIQALKGKNSDFCFTLDNYAATLNDWFNARQLCDFSQILTTANGDKRPTTTFSGDDEVWLRIQDKYVNVMAQLTDGYDYLQQVVGYTPRKVKALSGTPLTLPPVKQLIGPHAVTPCLNFPDVAVDALNDILDSVGSLAGPLGYFFAGTVESIYEDDMWLPDIGDTLTSRGIASHEYGHFAMCSLLYDEDSTKMVQIPSLIIQRILDGQNETSTSETAYLMEGWADFFAGQLVSGASYFSMENQFPRDGTMSYCRGDSTKGPCWDWNYVEDFNSASDGTTDTIGFDNQVRRVATTLFDAFDGQHAASTQTTTAPTPSAGGTPPWGLGGLLNGALRPIANAAFTSIPISISRPGNGDFWNQGDPTPIASGSVHNGDAKDEVIALPGAGLRTLVHNWTHNTSALDWRVNQQQFFAALNATIRGTVSANEPSRDYNWCEVCQMFAQHDGLSCSVTGNTSQGGFCVDGGQDATEPTMTVPEMVQVCTQSPTIPGFIGVPPAGSDPTSPCSFTGCPAHTILIGDVGDKVASCTACGPHQVSTGTHACGADVCATPNVSGSTCTDCPDDQVVGGADGNTCVSCPALQIPNADRTACIPCGPHQIASDVSCVDCANDQIAMPDNTCQACPDGQMPYSNQGIGASEPTYGESCLPTTECSCGSGACRTVNSNGICQGTIG